MLAARPAMTIEKVSCCDSIQLFYNISDVKEAWRLLLLAPASIVKQHTFQVDLVVVSIQALSNFAIDLHATSVAAYYAKNQSKFDATMAILLDVLMDADTLLGTQREFLLGAWIRDARAWGSETSPSCGARPRTNCPGAFPGITQQECDALSCCWDTSEPNVPWCFVHDMTPNADIFELNARTQITLWGPSDSFLHEYAYHLWQGLVGSFYRERCQQWATGVSAALQAGSSFDEGQFLSRIQAWELAWTKSTNSSLFLSEPKGEAYALSSAAFIKYMR